MQKLLKKSYMLSTKDNHDMYGLNNTDGAHIKMNKVTWL